MHCFFLYRRLYVITNVANTSTAITWFQHEMLIVYLHKSIYIFIICLIATCFMINIRSEQFILGYILFICLRCRLIILITIGWRGTNRYNLLSQFINALFLRTRLTLMLAIHMLSGFENMCDIYAIGWVCDVGNQSNSYYVLELGRLQISVID